MKTDISKEILKDIGKALTDIFIKNNLIPNKYVSISVQKAKKFRVLYEEKSDTTWYALTITRWVFEGIDPKWSIKRIKFIEKLLNEKIADVCKNIFKDDLFLTDEQVNKLYIMSKIYN